MPMIDVYAPTGLFPVGADRQLAEELTAALLKAEGVANPGPTRRTWVLLTEAAEGGWGVAGTAFGKEEFAALAAKKK
jgi:phenylpyruvate tautomerase PptA (4-oxalocrotonate tautomerase family)